MFQISLRMIMSKLFLIKSQVIEYQCDLSKAHVTIQAGAMQWMVGNINASNGLKGVGDLFSKVIPGKVIGESAIKPEYRGMVC